MEVGSDGRLEWVTRYYDPIVNHKVNLGPGGGVGTAFLLLPQDPELAELLYESAGERARLERSARRDRAVRQRARARAANSATTRPWRGLRAAAERDYEPRFFGDHDEKFGWWFGLNEAYPRGTAERRHDGGRGRRGRRLAPRARRAPHGQVRRAYRRGGSTSRRWASTRRGTTPRAARCTSAPIRRPPTGAGWRRAGGSRTCPPPDQVFVLCDGAPFTRFAVEGENSIRIDGTIDLRQYQISHRLPGPPARRGAEAARRPAAGRPARCGRPARRPPPTGECAPGDHQPRRGRRAGLLLLSGVGVGAVQRRGLPAGLVGRRAEPPGDDWRARSPRSGTAD